MNQMISNQDEQIN